MSGKKNEPEAQPEVVTDGITGVVNPDDPTRHDPSGAAEAYGVPEDGGGYSTEPEAEKS